MSDQFERNLPVPVNVNNYSFTNARTLGEKKGQVFKEISTDHIHLWITDEFTLVR